MDQKLDLTKILKYIGSWTKIWTYCCVYHSLLPSLKSYSPQNGMDIMTRSVLDFLYLNQEIMDQHFLSRLKFLSDFFVSPHRLHISAYMDDWTMWLKRWESLHSPLGSKMFHLVATKWKVIGWLAGWLIDFQTKRLTV